MPSVDGKATRKLDARSILALPSVYEFFQDLIGAHRSRIECMELYIRPKASDRVLDCGCGPGILVDYLPAVDYVGIDVDEAYITAARSRYGERATFRLGSVGRDTIHEEDHYDLVLAWGLLHHLDDEQASEFLRLAYRCLKPTGRLVTMDGCYSKDQSTASRYLLSSDRGAHVRSLEAWLDLVRPFFPQVEAHLRYDLLRIPWTHLIMECQAGPRSIYSVSPQSAQVPDSGTTSKRPTATAPPHAMQTP